MLFNKSILAILYNINKKLISNINIIIKLDFFYKINYTLN